MHLETQNWQLLFPYVSKNIQLACEKEEISCNFSHPDEQIIRKFYKTRIRIPEQK